jgi:hypothetical protein
MAASLSGLVRISKPVGQPFVVRSKVIGLWRNGRKGRAGGPALIHMQAEIVAYAKRHSGGDEG